MVISVTVSTEKGTRSRLQKNRAYV